MRFFRTDGSAPKQHLTVSNSRVGGGGGCLYNRRSRSPRTARSDGSPPHAQRLSLDAVEERRGAHDRDRRASGRFRARRVRVEGQHRRHRARWPVLALSRHRSHDRAARRLRNAPDERHVRYGAHDRVSWPHDFSGDDAVDCTLLAGPCRDFNAMFRRGRARGRVAVVRGSSEQFEPAQFHLSYAAKGPHECTIAGLGSTSAGRGSCAARRRGTIRCADRSGSSSGRLRPMPWRWSSASTANEALCDRRADAAWMVARRRDRRRRRRNDRAG